jgi:hypothetical protein
LNTKTATDPAVATPSAFLADGFHAAVADVSGKGFTILLPSPALQDYTYSWTAARVVNPKYVKSSSILGDLLNSATDSGSIAGVATESGTASGSGTLVP